MSWEPARPEAARVQFLSGMVLDLEERGPGDLGQLVGALERADITGGALWLEGVRRLLEKEAYMLSFRTLEGDKVLVAARVSVAHHGRGPGLLPAPRVRAGCPKTGVSVALVLSGPDDPCPASSTRGLEVTSASLGLGQAGVWKCHRRGSEGALAVTRWGRQRAPRDCSAVYWRL